MGVVAELPNDVAALKNIIRELNAKFLWTEEKLRSLVRRSFRSNKEKYTTDRRTPRTSGS
ncbi:hypothetical protein [Gracilinema caldarium]|uniref:hypothetical protein n=1 Tax=Gracilinema caldarium TaxID=215591 RepID=UPI001F25424F|nr:hypothetical protein [Gracilinema caldarium]